MFYSEERPGSKYSPIDLNTTLLVKYISDWSQLLKKISPFSSLIFIILNFGKLARNKKAWITAALFLPALALTPSFDIVRFIFTIFILWIFLVKFNRPDTRFASGVAFVVALYSVIMFAGIFFPQFYFKTDNSFRYKFIVESHNALSILVFFSFVYLVNYFLQRRESQAKWMQVFSFVAILLLCVVLLLIKSRLYMAMSFMLISILALKNLRANRIFAIVPVWYALAFLGVTQISQFVIRPSQNTVAATGRKDTAASRPSIAIVAPPGADSTKKMTRVVTTTKKISTVPKTEPSKTPTVAKDTNRLNMDSIKRQEALQLVDNNRVFSLSGTGREKMWYTFVQLFRDSGWKKFIYQNNTKPYFERKAKLPYINVNASTLTENSYMLVLLSTGFIGLLVFFFVFIHYFRYFISQKAFFTTLYFLLLMAVWFYEESLAFPFSMIAHLFALMTVFRFEKKQHETSISHKHAGALQTTGVE